MGTKGAPRPRPKPKPRNKGKTEEKKQLRDDGAHYRYAGKCRRCGHHEEWAIDKAGWSPFADYVHKTKFPCFVDHCPGCDNQAVFDLTAYSRYPSE